MTTTTTARQTLPAAGHWDIDPSHSGVSFSVRHLGLSKVRGRFTQFSGAVEVAENPVDSSVAVEIQAASIDTHDAGRDEHLRTGDFIDAATYPTLTFASTKVVGEGERWTVEGDLTIRGVTRPVVLDVEFDGTATDPWGGSRAAFSARTEIDREDWGLTYNQALEAGGFLIGKKVTIDLEVELVLAK